MSDCNVSQEAFEKAKATAVEAGFTVREEAANELLLDIDTPFGPKVRSELKGRINILNKILSTAEMPAKLFLKEMAQSKSGNTHAVVTWSLQHEDHAFIRCVLRAALGSDPFREVYTLIKVLNKVPNPSVLFRPAKKRSL